MKLFIVFTGTALLLSLVVTSCRTDDESELSPPFIENPAAFSSFDEPTDPPKDVPKDRDNWKPAVR